MGKFYITTAIPYVNARPHIGHALEFVQADVLARFHRLSGDETMLLSGADENSLKNVQAAEKEGLPIQEFLDKYSQIFRDFGSLLNTQIDLFQRGSDQQSHWPGVQKFWQRCQESGDLYKKSYSGLYCVGCELFYTPEELIDGKCPIHLRELDRVTEENYFFRLSRYQERIKQAIETDEVRIVPENRKTEMLRFIEKGLEDFSVSRTKERARGVGVPIPGDDMQVMYVWFDALNIYLTGLGFGQTDESRWQKFWPADVHAIGKDILRFHAVYWLGMLLSAGLPLPKIILTHGFITSGGHKMSKSLGNVIDPFAMVEKYGVDPIRYYLLREIPTLDDGDFSETRFVELYTAELANSLGNTASRIAKMAANVGYSQSSPSLDWKYWYPEVKTALNDTLDIRAGISHIVSVLADLEKQIAIEKPWTWKIEDAQKLEKFVGAIYTIAWNLQPYLPSTAEKLLAHFSEGKIEPLTPLFPRM